MISCKVNFVFIFIFINYIDTQFIGDPCTLQSTGQAGVCSALTQCKKALEGLAQQIFPQTCGFDGTSPIVCCASASIPPGPVPTTSPEYEESSGPPTRKPTTEPTTTTTKKAVVPPAGSRNPGEASKIKCREYSEYVYEIKYPPIPLVGVKPEKYDECAIKVVPLIVGGENASTKEFPHMTLVGYQPKPDQILWNCGGSIISDYYILSAGHCLAHRELGEAKYIRVGLTEKSKLDHMQQIAIAEGIRYPEYTPSLHYHDIALFRLKTPIQLNPYARPACLFTDYHIPFRKSIASGWGRTGYTDDPSDRLLKVTLDFFTVSSCNYSYRNQIRKKLKFGILDESQICTGVLKGNSSKDTCQGDSGGPLQIFHSEEDAHCMYDIVGITSFGKACGVGRSPGVYTRVSNYVKWIEDIVWP